MLPYKATDTTARRLGKAFRDDLKALQIACKNSAVEVQSRHGSRLFVFADGSAIRVTKDGWQYARAEMDFPASYARDYH